MLARVRPDSPRGKAAEGPDRADDPYPYREPVDAGRDCRYPDRPGGLLELVLLVLGPGRPLRVLERRPALQLEVITPPGARPRSPTTEADVVTRKEIARVLKPLIVLKVVSRHMHHALIVAVARSEEH